MRDAIVFNRIDEITIKLLHYFIIEKGYNPIVLQGAKNEIWLENLSSDYKIVRISSDYIHNNEQLNFDIYKTKQILKKIKRKTFSFSINTLNIFVNLGENVSLKDIDIDKIDIVNLNEIDEIKKYKFVIDTFPDIANKTTFSEKGIELFVKLTTEINKKGESDAIKAENLFKEKKPTITPILIGLNILIYVLCVLMGGGSVDLDASFLASFGGLLSPNNMGNEYYRIITSAFLHSGILHLFFNCYALYYVGPKIEGFYGKVQFLLIYFGSLIIGSLLSLLFLGDNTVAVGASGAIFGLFGSLLYFGYYYRPYLGTVLISQILPIILINLALGFMTPGIGNGAHIGGLIGGVLTSMAVGVKDKTEGSNRINGTIILIIFTIFLIYMGFYR